jgi:putative endonuclease
VKPEAERDNTTAVGRRAENAACRFLLEQGLKLVQRNYRGRCGEIDLVMEQGATLVFVEIRYRRGDRFGGAEETVDRRKRARLISAASDYLQHHPGAQRRPSRFDVVALVADREGHRLRWIADAFRA